jgi:hypothetical protein
MAQRDIEMTHEYVLRQLYWYPYSGLNILAFNWQKCNDNVVGVIFTKYNAL